MKRWRLIPTSANGQPALAGYLWDEQTEAFMRYCLYVPTLRERRIEEIAAFVTPETFQRFGLPESMPLRTSAPGQGVIVPSHGRPVTPLSSPGGIG